jgi:wyosine [tRNA(Phe)-imidazoG37] synthetase (radical SAM superfamily)
MGGRPSPVQGRVPEPEESMSEHVYGPVASRRLGRSLGLDLVPLKTCNLNCVYCQLGPTPLTTSERRAYVPADAVLEELQARIGEGLDADYVTLGGSGEPTLNTAFGEVASGVRAACDVPVALLTNGTLFHLREVREACADVDLVLPSLDAGDEPTFQRVNRPHAGLTLAHVVEGLARLRDEFAGQIWLEVMVVEGLNASPEQVRRIRTQIERVRPDRVQVNTPVRPPAEAAVGAADREILERICEALGPTAEVIAPLGPGAATAQAAVRQDEVLAVLRRRPCTVADISAGLGIVPNEAVKLVQALLNRGAIRRRQRLYETYYEPSSGG